MKSPESALLEQLEKSRKLYQTALIDLRLAEDAAKRLLDADGTHLLTSARFKLRGAARDYQEALREFSNFALREAGKHSAALGGG